MNLNLSMPDNKNNTGILKTFEKKQKQIVDIYIVFFSLDLYARTVSVRATTPNGKFLPVREVSAFPFG